MLNTISMDAHTQTEILKGFSDIYTNEKVDFSERLEALRKQQMLAVQKHQLEGLMLVLEYELRLYTPKELVNALEITHFTNAPQQCPWHHIAALPLEKAIEKLWRDFPCTFSQSLAQECKNLFVVQASGKWFLAYACINSTYNGQEHYEFLLGAVAEPDAQLPADLVNSGWKMPQDLKAFYKVHSVFGDINSTLKNDNTHCIASADKLKASLTFMEQVVKEQEDEVNYSFYDLLPFCEDGAGNSHNFYKASPTADSYMTLDWDHETRKIGREMTFAEYLDEQFGTKVRAEW